MNKTLMVVALLFTAHDAVAQNPNLKIVVIEGEGAVNIIQQKTAVAPIVEIRDRNNLPVSGATVTFSIGGGNSAAFAGGAQTLTVTTNAAGRAVAAALNPLGGGSFQIQVSAAFQGQTAAATIAQTNVLTIAEGAAQTAGASGAGGAGGSSGGGTAAGGASGGGGLSGTTIGIIGAAVGGGALAATQVGGSDALAATQVGGPTSGGSRSTSFAGSFSAQMVFTQNSGGIICDSTRSLSGTLKITLEDGEAKGFADVTGTSSEVSITASPFCSPIGTQSPLNLHADATGGPAALSFASQNSFTSTGTATVTSTVAWSFTGSLSGGAITGTVTYTQTTSGIGTPGGHVIDGRGTVAMPVTLR